MPEPTSRPDRPAGQAPSWRPGGSDRPHGTGSPIGMIIRLLLAIAALVVVAAAVINHTAGRWERDPDGPPISAFFILAGIGVLVWLVIRRLRRTFKPVAAVIDATSRVADGDYSVRVEPSGPPDVREMVSAFNTMASRLESNESQRRRLFSDIAHELRTPLTVIQGTVEGVVDGVYPADDEHLAPVLDQVRLMARLLVDLQTLANAEAGQLSLNTTRTDLSALLDDVARSFLPSASRAGVSLRRTGPKDIQADIDPERFRQVVDNLVTNALRYTDEGGEIVLGITRDSAVVRVTVTDTGRGIAPEDIERMFDRFHKSVDSGGTGLGLAIARGLVQAHRGTISADSAPGAGTRILIELPTS